MSIHDYEATAHPDAKTAYIRWCRKNGHRTVYKMIHDAVERGDGEIGYRGFLPPVVINELEAEGFYVEQQDVTTFGSARRVCYTIQWGA